LELALPKNDPARTLADDVREALSETLSADRPTVSKVARSPGMSVRTLVSEFAGHVVQRRIKRSVSAVAGWLSIA
jgi:AraC-like DNA-binding protein